MGVLNRLKHKISKRNMITLANGLIVSKISYGIACYGTPRLCVNDPINSDMNRLQVALNNVMRLILGIRLSDKVSVSQLLNECGWLSLNRLAIKFTALQAWKLLAYETEPNLVTDLSSNYTRATRAANRGDFNPNPSKTSTFTVQAARILNNNDFCSIFDYIDPKNVKSFLKETLNCAPI